MQWWSNAVHFACLCFRAAFRTPANPWDTPLPLCVGHVWEEQAFSLVHVLPSPLSADGCASLFEGFTGTITWSDSSKTCVKAVWQCAFASRSVPCWYPDISEVSRFSCRKFLDVREFSDYAELTEDSRLRPQSYSLPPKSSGVGTPIAAFRSSITQPADAPVYASMVTSRCHRRTWGQDGSLLLSCRTLAFPTSCRFIPAHRLWPFGIRGIVNKRLGFQFGTWVFECRLFHPTFKKCKLLTINGLYCQGFKPVEMDKVGAPG